MRLKSRAFTLIEVLLVSVLISVISLAIFRCFANGLKLWGRAQRLNNEVEVAIFLEKIADDLRSTVNMSGLDFKGTISKVSFPSIVRTKADPKSARVEEVLINQIGKIEYYYDFSKHAIFRRQANYSQALKDKWQIQDSPVVSDIDSLEFHYDIASQKDFSLKSETRGGIPLGIMVDVHYSDRSGQHQLKRYIPIPVGGS